MGFQAINVLFLYFTIILANLMKSWSIRMIYQRQLIVHLLIYHHLLLCEVCSTNWKQRILSFYCQYIVLAIVLVTDYFSSKMVKSQIKLASWVIIPDFMFYQLICKSSFVYLVFLCLLSSSLFVYLDRNDFKDILNEILIVIDVYYIIHYNIFEQLLCLSQQCFYLTL